MGLLIIVIDNIETSELWTCKFNMCTDLESVLVLLRVFEIIRV